MVGNKAQSPTVQGERQLAFRMAMPFEWNLRDLPIEHSNRAVFGDCDVFELWFHPCSPLLEFGHNFLLNCPNNIISWPIWHSPTPSGCLRSSHAVHSEPCTIRQA